ncbi:hypothetical protein G4177_06305 [Corallococcus sp. ZKHCc1 1396]|uniref:Uncharacterized protein n=1 Tax=Corallococcus soli TaxID=2710757 RepID=A0ABR9PIT0_9BACT|nr:hypothetical protein [Corallococcus soli]MBE4747790.1 hypothetical protein [Corallococcus soli]
MAEQKRTKPPREVLRAYFDTHEVEPEVLRAWKELDTTVEGLAIRLSSDLTQLKGAK